MSRYEIQTYLPDLGWMNVWQMKDENGNLVPQSFETFDLAEAALIELQAGIEYDIEQHLEMDDPDMRFAVEEFRIVKVFNPMKGY